MERKARKLTFDTTQVTELAIGAAIGGAGQTELDANETQRCIQALQTPITAQQSVDVKGVYTTLEPGNFRLLDLTLDKTRKYIPCCSLRTCPVGEESYVAISHTWIDKEYCWYGQKLPSKTQLVIDGEVVGVASRIVLILALAFQLGIKSVWIDALCINQADIEERGHQVGNMGRVFQLSNEVLVVLGKPTVNTDRALRDIPFCVPPYQAMKGRHQGLQEILRHQYWYRAWILQELGLASTLR